MGGGLMELVAYGAEAAFTWVRPVSQLGYVADNDVYAAAARKALDYPDAVVFDTKHTFEQLQNKFCDYLDGNPATSSKFLDKKMAGQALSLAWDFVNEHNGLVGHYAAAFIAPPKCDHIVDGMMFGVATGETGPDSVSYLYVIGKSRITEMGISPAGEQEQWGFPESDIYTANSMVSQVRARAGYPKNRFQSFALRPEEHQPSLLPLEMKKIGRVFQLPHGDDVALGLVLKEFDSETVHAGKRKIFYALQYIYGGAGANAL